MQGFGDVIAKVTNALGIKQCEDCKRRQEYLNSLIPFSKITADDIEFLDSVFVWYKGLPIPRDRIEDIKKCEAIWLKTKKAKGCKTCGSDYQNGFMNDLKKLWEYTTQKEK